MGTMSQIFVGGVENDWEFFVAGAPVKEMCDAATEAQSGQLVISPSACALLNDQYVGSKLPSGYFRLENLVDVPVLPRSSPPKIDASQEEALASFVPDGVKNFVDAGNSISWLGEYRRVSIMFVMLPEVSVSWPLFFCEI